MKAKGIIVGVAAIGCAASSQAAIVGVGGASVLVSAPFFATLNAYTHPTEVRVWDELQNVALTSSVVADANSPGLYDDPGDLSSVFINSGTFVSSHYVHFDTPGAAAGFAMGSVTFSEKIIGVMALGDAGSFFRLDDSDFLSGGTAYDDGLVDRGLEIIAMGQGDTFGISLDGKTLHYSFNVTEPGDRIRVVTEAAVPEPVSLACLAIGGAILARRQRKRLTSPE